MNDGAVSGATSQRRTSVASAATILMIGFVLSRLLGLVRVSLQGRILGAADPHAAAFATAITIPDTVFTLVSGGALGSSFIPVFAAMLEHGDEERAWRVASGVMNGVLIVLLGGVGVAELAAPWIVDVINHNGDQALTLTLTRIMLLQPLFLALSGILMGVHNSYHRFIAPAVAPLVYNVANIVGLLLIPVLHGNIALAAWGVTVGAFLQVLVLLPGLARYRALVGPGVGLDQPGAREVGRLMAPRIVGQAGIQLTGVVTVFLADNYFVDQPTNGIRIAANLMALPVGIFGSAIATAAFPTMTGQAARGDLSALGATVSRTLRTMLFLAIPAAIGLMVLRYPITEVLFRGQNFHAHDVDVVAAGLLLYGAGVPALAAVELLPRAFFALKDTWTPVLVNLVTLATAVALSVLGTYLAHGDSIVGVAMLTGAISITVVMEVVWLGVILRQRVANLGLREVALSALRALVAGEAMGVALLALLYLWGRAGPAGVLGNALLLLIALPLGVVVYAGWAYVVRAPEMDTAWEMVRARLRR